MDFQKKAEKKIAQNSMLTKKQLWMEFETIQYF